MTDKPNIHQRMFAVMEEMHGSPLLKEKKGGVPYMTLSHDTVSKALRPLFIKHGILTTASVVEHGRDGNLTWATVEVAFYNAEMGINEAPITVRAFGYGVDQQDKGPGKSISYAVKYAYLKAFCLETTDDPENESIDRKPSKGTPKGETTPQRVPAASGDASGWDGSKLIDFGKKYAGTPWRDVPDGYLDWIMQNVEKDFIVEDARLEIMRREGGR